MCSQNNWGQKKVLNNLTLKDKNILNIKYKTYIEATLEAEFTKKLSNTEDELKKALLIKKSV